MLVAALSARSASKWWWLTLLVGVTGVVAGAIWAVAPAAWQHFIASDQRTDGSVATVLGIWMTNFVVVAAVPLIVAAVAFSSRQRGGRRWALGLILFATLSELRNPVGIGFVGGLDPAWLLGASPWWVFELLAVSVTCSAAWRTWPMTDVEAGTRVLRRAVVHSALILSVAAIIEVAMT